MKIIFEDGEKEYIQRINANLNTDNPVPVFCGEKRSYSISFDVVDIAKANAFISFLMSPTEEKQKEIEQMIGINIKSVNYQSGDLKLANLKSMLRKFLEELENV